MRDFLKYTFTRRLKSALGVIYGRLKTIYNIQKKKHIVKNYKPSPKYLNVGGAQFVRKQWKILDYIFPNWYYSNPIFVDFNIDLEKCERWPMETESYDLVYTSHTLEHLSQRAVYQTLKEIYRILKKRGGLRISVPDIDLILSHYKTRDEKWFGMEYPGLKENCPLEFFLLDFFAGNLIGKVSSEEVKKDFNSMDKVSFLNKYIGLIQDSWQKERPTHRNWFNFEKLEGILKEIGFSQIIRSSPRQSIFSELCNKEFDKTAIQHSVYIDAVK